MANICLTKGFCRDFFDGRTLPPTDGAMSENPQLHAIGSEPDNYLMPKEYAEWIFYRQLSNGYKSLSLTGTYPYYDLHTILGIPARDYRGLELWAPGHTNWNNLYTITTVNLRINLQTLSYEAAQAFTQGVNGTIHLKYGFADAKAISTPTTSKTANANLSTTVSYARGTADGWRTVTIPNKAAYHTQLKIVSWVPMSYDATYFCVANGKSTMQDTITGTEPGYSYLQLNNTNRIFQIQFSQATTGASAGVNNYNKVKFCDRSASDSVSINEGTLLLAPMSNVKTINIDLYAEGGHEISRSGGSSAALMMIRGEEGVI